MQILSHLLFKEAFNVVSISLVACWLWIFYLYALIFFCVSFVCITFASNLRGFYIWRWCALWFKRFKLNIIYKLRQTAENKRFFFLQFVIFTRKSTRCKIKLNFNFYTTFCHDFLIYSNVQRGELNTQPVFFLEGGEGKLNGNELKSSYCDLIAYLDDCFSAQAWVWLHQIHYYLQAREDKRKFVIKQTIRLSNKIIVSSSEILHFFGHSAWVFVRFLSSKRLP